MVRLMLPYCNHTTRSGQPSICRPSSTMFRAGFLMVFTHLFVCLHIGIRFLKVSMVISIGNVQIVGGHMNRTISATIHLWQPKRCQKERSKPQTVIKHDQIISNYVYIVPCLSIRGLHYIPKIWFLLNMNQP